MSCPCGLGRSPQSWHPVVPPTGDWGLGALPQQEPEDGAIAGQCRSWLTVPDESTEKVVDVFETSTSVPELSEWRLCFETVRLSLDFCTSALATVLERVCMSGCIGLGSPVFSWEIGPAARCVSAKSSDPELLPAARSFKSMRNKPRDESCIGNSFCKYLDQIVWVSTSILAFRALNKVFDTKKGVFPGTTAIFKRNPWMGTTRACWLCNVPWFPNLNVTWHGTRISCFWISGWSPAISSLTCWLPITVLVAPRSTTPNVPWVAKHVNPSESSGAFIRDRSFLRDSMFITELVETNGFCLAFKHDCNFGYVEPDSCQDIKHMEVQGSSKVFSSGICMNSMGKGVTWRDLSTHKGCWGRWRIRASDSLWAFCFPVSASLTDPAFGGQNPLLQCATWFAPKLALHLVFALSFSWFPWSQRPEASWPELLRQLSSSLRVTVQGRCQLFVACH